MDAILVFPALQPRVARAGSREGTGHGRSGTAACAVLDPREGRRQRQQHRQQDQPPVRLARSWRDDPEGQEHGVREADPGAVVQQHIDAVLAFAAVGVVEAPRRRASMVVPSEAEVDQVVAAGGGVEPDARVLRDTSGEAVIRMLTG